MTFSTFFLERNSEIHSHLSRFKCINISSVSLEKLFLSKLKTHRVTDITLTYDSLIRILGLAIGSRNGSLSADALPIFIKRTKIVIKQKIPRAAIIRNRLVLALGSLR